MTDRTYTEAEVQAAVAAALREAAVGLVKASQAARCPQQRMGVKKAAQLVQAIAERSFSEGPSALDRVVAEAEARGMERAGRYLLAESKTYPDSIAWAVEEDAKDILAQAAAIRAQKIALHEKAPGDKTGG